MNAVAEKIIPTENGDAWPFLMQMEMADAHLRELLNAMGDEVEDDKQAAMIAGALALMDGRKEAHTELFEFCRAKSHGKISKFAMAKLDGAFRNLDATIAIGVEGEAKTNVENAIDCLRYVRGELRQMTLTSFGASS